MPGREEELPARGRLLSLLIALCQERREFSSIELAAISGIAVLLRAKTEEDATRSALLDCRTDRACMFYLIF